MPIHSTLAPHIAALIEKNKEALINSAVADPATRAKLLEINKAITELKARDPSIVAAWGLGCGGSCLTGVEAGDLVRPGAGDFLPR